MTTYQVEYIGWRPSDAMYTTHPEAKGYNVTYLFKVTSREETRFLQVGIASLLPKEPGWVSLEVTDHMKVAAKAVEYFLAQTVPPDHLVDADTIKLTTHWYPGHGGPPEIREDYQSFSVKVEKRKPPLGFIKD